MKMLPEIDPVSWRLWTFVADWAIVLRNAELESDFWNRSSDAKVRLADFLCALIFDLDVPRVSSLRFGTAETKFEPLIGASYFFKSAGLLYFSGEFPKELSILRGLAELRVAING